MFLIFLFFSTSFVLQLVMKEVVLRKRCCSKFLKTKKKKKKIREYFYTKSHIKCTFS